MKKFFKQIFTGELSLLLLLSTIVFAGTFFQPSCAAGLVPCTNDCNLCYLLVGISNIFQWLMGALLVIAVLLGITVAGLAFMISGAFPSILAFAKNTLTTTLKGLILALIAWLIINGIMNIVGYKHPYGGHWWEFNCSTSSSVPSSSALA